MTNPSPAVQTPPPQSLGEHVRRTLALALPVVASRAGVVLLVAVDTAMTGHFGGRDLAYLGLGSAPMVVLLLLGIGMLMGTPILTAQAHGAGEETLCGSIWRVGLWHALGLGLLCAVLMQFGEAFLLMIGQDADLAAGAGRVLKVFSWQMPALMFYVCTTGFLEALGKPLPGMIVMLVINILNIGLNWFFVFGNGGLPAMGAEGAVTATGIVRWLAVLMLVGYALTMPDRKRYGVGLRVGDGFEIGRKLRRLGLPMAVTQGVETSAFMAMTMMAGYLGATAVSGYQISMNLLALVFMAAVGTATAAGVRVGNAVGRGDFHGVRLAGWVALGLVALTMGAIGTAFVSAPEWFAAFYSSEAPVLRIAAASITIAGMLLMFDGAQSVLIGALRGMGDAWMPMGIQVIAFWGLTIPLAGYFTFSLGHGAPGLMEGIFAGVVVSASLNLLRFNHVSKRRIRRY